MADLDRPSIERLHRARIGAVDLTETGNLLLESPESAVFGDERFVALVGVPGVTVVDTEEALLVVANDRAEEVKTVVEQLRKRGRKDLL